jgi:hypothetical protein
MQLFVKDEKIFCEKTARLSDRFPKRDVSPGFARQSILFLYGKTVMDELGSVFLNTANFPI